MHGFKINEMLVSIPIGDKKYINVILNHATQKILSDKSLRVKSFVITPDSYRTKKVISSFKRNDHRIRQKIYSKLGNRRARRVKQFLNRISKDIVQKAKASNSMIILEDIKGIRKLYRKGNGQGNKHKAMMNSWPFYELQRQVQYKSAWEGIPVKFISSMRTSILCPICGSRTQEDRYQHHQLWCSSCKKIMDRDIVAAMNISHKGLQKFCNPSGLSEETMKENLGNAMPIILRVDGSKLGLRA